jgi:Trk K+ transport system NAD-binding subunit
VIENPSGDFDLKPGDEVIVIGTPDKIRYLADMFHAINHQMSVKAPGNSSPPDLK